jgi:hypothetical protein
MVTCLKQAHDATEESTPRVAATIEEDTERGLLTRSLPGRKVVSLPGHKVVYAAYTIFTLG